MIMGEEIEEAAKKYAECREPHCEDGDCSPYCELMGFCCDRGIEVIKEYTEDAFKAGAKWILEQAYSKGTLSDWYQASIDNTIPPIWTDKHINELSEDFYCIRK